MDKENAISRLSDCKSKLLKQLLMLSIGFFIGLTVGIVLMLTVNLHIVFVIYIAFTLSTFFKGISVLRVDNIRHDDGMIELIMLVIILVVSPFYTIYCFVCVTRDLVRANRLEGKINSSLDENEWIFALQKLEERSKIKR